MVLKIAGVDTAVPLPLCVRPAIVTAILDTPTRYVVDDYYYGFDSVAVAEDITTYPLDENAVFAVDQRVVIITAGIKTYIVGAAAAATRILVHITGASTGSGHPFEEWDPVGAAAVTDGETGYAKEYNASTDTMTGLIVWAEKHGDDWKFFYPIRNSCDG